MKTGINLGMSLPLCSHMTSRVRRFCRDFIFGAGKSLLLWLCLGIAVANPAKAACLVVVGPTSDPSLTQANLVWTEEVVERVAEGGISCRLEFIEAWSRANAMFASGEADVLFPEIVGDPLQPGMTGMPVARTHGFVILTRANEPVIDEIEALAGKTLGIVRGRFYPTELRSQPDIELIEANSLEQNVRKLLHDRIDALVEYQKDINAMIRRNDLSEQVHFGVAFGDTPLAYRFANTPEGARLMEAFNLAIRQLIHEGRYNAVFSGTSQRLLY